jgi:O-antigen/teichoic acid export membrane protein
MINENIKTPLYSLLSQSIRLLSGPITLLVVSSSLTNEQMSFYFSFFSLIAMQQLLEMGLGYTVKQFIAHAYKEEDGIWKVTSIKDVKSYFRFTCLWFLFLVLFILLGIGFLGYYFFSSYAGNIDWLSSWWCLVFVSAVATGLSPILFVLEGCQKQVQIYKGRMISAIVSSLSLWIAMIMQLDLYSIAISVLISNLVLFKYLYPHISRLLVIFRKSPGHSKEIKEVFKELWPMLSKLSVTWGMGYLFWNSFNLTAFKLFTPEQAGKFGFTLALARAGFGIAESIVNSQSTIYSRNISEGKILQAKASFTKSLFISQVLILAGYGLYLVAYKFYPSFYLFDKTLSLWVTIQIFLYFSLLLPVNSQANFCRCFKKEPYFKLSMFCNISVPVVFLITSYIFRDVVFIYLLPLSIIFILWSRIIFKTTLKNEIKKKNNSLIE